jgi:hypothetical protein
MMYALTRAFIINKKYIQKMCSVLRFEQVILYVKYYIFGARSSSSGGRLLYNIYIIIKINGIVMPA